MPELKDATELMVTDDLLLGGVDSLLEYAMFVQDGELIKIPIPQIVGIRTGAVALSGLAGGAAFEISDAAEIGTHCNILADQKTIEFLTAVPRASIGLTVQMFRVGGSSDTLKIFVKVSTDGGTTYGAVPLAMWERVVAPDTQSDRYIEFPAFNIQAGWRIQLWATQTDAITFDTVPADGVNDIPAAPAVRVVVKG